MAHSGSHTVMPKKLAQALIEAGMHHFDVGGQVPQNTGFNTAGAQGDNPVNPNTALDIPRNVNMIGNNVQNPAAGLQSGANNTGALLGQTVNGLGGIMKDAAGSFTSLNNFQAQAPGIATQNYSPQISNLQNQQQQTYNQQQNLANTLLNQSQGRGPNPAQAQFAQNTGANVAQQGALMASQRGAGSNVGLIARQAAQQGAGIQQNATGQAATLQANQQLAAQQSLQQALANMANQSLQGESIQQGGLAAQNTALTTGQLGAQNINANVSGQNASALNGTAGGIANALGGGLVNLLNKGGEVKKMADGGIMKYDAPQAEPLNLPTWKNQGVLINSPKAGEKKPNGSTGENAGKASPSLMAGGPGDAGSIPPNTMVAACGGMVPHYDEGGDVQNVGAIGDITGMPTQSPQAPIAPLMGLDNFGMQAQAPQAGGNVVDKGISAAPPGGGGGGGGLGGMLALLAHGGNVQFSNALLNGGDVKGKAKVKGDSEKNDTQPTMLSPGEVVLPRSVTQAKDPEKKAVEFLRHLKKGKAKGYDDVTAARVAKKACGGKV